MSGDRDAEGGADGVHVDPISEFEAEAEADAPDLEHGLPHLIHPRTVADGGVGSDAGSPGTPPNPRAGRQRFLVAYLRVALVLAFGVGVLELLLPESLRDEAATVMVAVFVLAPLGRVVWLMVRWVRRRDWRFAAVGAVLLAVVAVGFLLR